VLVKDLLNSHESQPQPLILEPRWVWGLAHASHTLGPPVRGLTGGAFSSYLQSTLLSCAAAICHLPLRFNQVSVQTWHCLASGFVLSLPMACSLP